MNGEQTVAERGSEGTVDWGLNDRLKMKKERGRLKGN